MANWTEPVYDRIQADIEYAKKKLNQWRNNPPENYEELKGCFNVSDINRIEQNTAFIRDWLNSLGYQIVFQYEPNYHWAMGDIPTFLDITTRLIGNIQTIKDNFLPNAVWDALPHTIENFESVNMIERWLYDLHRLVSYRIHKYCNSFNAGCDLFLPLV